MRTRAPTFGQVAIAAVFSLSCFGLLIFLWSTFGGPVPLQPTGYRFKVPVLEATTLAKESDVRIAGVSVGKVKDIETGPDNNAIATIELDDPYAPIPVDTKAILRQKTLLGETYVELAPGNKDGPKLPEGDTLAEAQVGDTVQLDEIFRTFDARTRAAFETWMQGAAEATRGRGADLSAAIGNLEPFATDADRVLRVLDTQNEAVSQLVRNTGVVFSAISERQGQLRGLIQNADTVFHTTAQRNADLEQTFRVLPTFLDQSRLTLDRLNQFAKDTDPLIRQLRPAARNLTPVARNLAKAAPDFRTFFVGLRRLANKSQTGLPALRTVLGSDLPPLLAALDPFTNQLQPLVQALAPYKQEITAFLGNATAATQATNSTPESGGAQVHYLRTITPLSPETLAAFPNGRLETNRTNPYVAPGGYAKLAGGALDSFETRQCAAGEVATLDPNTPNDPNFNAITGGNIADATDLFNRLKLYAFGNANSTNAIPRPACNKQAPFASIGDIPELSDYLHVYQRNP
jgi:phospholipid/cholesterol/gamma-HCH transport system substrate-binding protein